MRSLIVLKFLSLFTVILLFGCAVTEDIISDYDDKIDFNYYETYVLCLDDFQVDNTKYTNLDNAFVRQLIGNELDNQMAALGYKTNVFKPQLQAGFKISIIEKENIVRNCEFESEFDYWRTCTINTVIYTQEALIIYVSDIEKNQVIWQASIPCELNKSKHALKKYTKELVDQLFLEYPEISK
ncbi:DUF4136 domain-containing protein [Oceanihabitans sp. 2_MG-2023]|uniref:DUF4136 domain-containing protein n=1 Tax=Oceanihabitans sp. 2_MG-2023 TaxID=3062661 RepID=UPI0026E1A2E4|nr:DUF4136 domain-containing protein [Oceanihabitans sp. 2_MG-2023]MDO6597499.1 DUF4136 domain-containing protein [Oceanihabitans sp. 2_MG-2023]